MKHSMTYLQHYDITWCIVKGVLNDDEDGSLIENVRDKFNLNWVIYMDKRW